MLSGKVQDRCCMIKESHPCRSEPCFLYVFISGWTVRLLPLLDYCKQQGNKYVITAVRLIALRHIPSVGTAESQYLLERYFKLFLCVHVFEKQLQTERQSHKDFPRAVFMSQMAVTAGTGLGHRNLKLHLGSGSRQKGPKYLSQLPLIFPGQQQRAGLKEQEPGHKPAPPIRNARIAAHGLMCYPTMPALFKKVLMTKGI